MNDIRANDLGHSEWDVVIIGAGVAGASAAILAAQNGLRTLLLEAKKFPREKVCGGCLNQRALQSLERLGVLDSLRQSGAKTINEFHIQIGGKSFRWPIPSMLSIRRSTMDQILVDFATKAGAIFFDQTKATVVPRSEATTSGSPLRQVSIQVNQQTVSVFARTVLVADGLTRSSLHRDKRWGSFVAPNSLIGVQQIFAIDSMEPEKSQSCLSMFVERDGYVGVSRTDGPLVNVAAAISPETIRANMSISDVIRGLSIGSLPPNVTLDSNTTWLATPALTRYSDMVADERVFLMGDAIGYVEPFTGEGMSWALASAEAVIPLVLENLRQGWSPKLAIHWTKWIQHQRKRKQGTCRWIARKLRHPQLALCIVRLFNVLGPLRSAIIKKVCS